MPLKVFISGTSRDLKTYRQTVTDWERERGYESIVRDEFPVLTSQSLPSGSGILV